MKRLLRPAMWGRGTGILVLGIVAMIIVAACGHGATACKVVDVASDACSVVRYLGPDGTVEELTAADLAKAAAAKRAARQRAAVTP